MENKILISRGKKNIQVKNEQLECQREENN
jgi:hypothetical protein